MRFLLDGIVDGIPFVHKSCWYWVHSKLVIGTCRYTLDFIISSFRFQKHLEVSNFGRVGAFNIFVREEQTVFVRKSEWKSKPEKFIQVYCRRYNSLTAKAKTWYLFDSALLGLRDFVRSPELEQTIQTDENKIIWTVLFPDSSIHSSAVVIKLTLVKRTENRHNKDTQLAWKVCGAERNWILPWPSSWLGSYSY